MKKYVIYNLDSSEEVGTFTEEQLNDENGFDDFDIKEIEELAVLESTVLSMEMAVIVLRVWDI